MMEPAARELIELHGTLRSERANWELHWQEIAELMRPMRADFTVQRAAGQKRGERIFDSAPGLANDNLASGIWSMATNSANTWFGLAHPDEALQRQRDVREWCDVSRSALLDVFSADGQAFYARAWDFYGDLTTFGTALFYTEAGEPGRVRFSHRALTECVIAEDDNEKVDTVIRQWKWTARQALKRWGDAAPEACRKAVADGKGQTLFTFLHGVMPNEMWNPRRRGQNSMAWQSITVCQESGTVCQRGGFREFPYQVARWSTATRSVYGESPAMLALADIKVLNSITKTQLVAAQKSADPPILAPDENALRSIRLSPGGITYGAVDGQGNPLVRTLENRGNASLTDVMAEQRRQAVREAFYASLLLMVQRPNVTATEVLARQEEQLRLMGAQLGRIQSEFLDPLIGRVFSIMQGRGELPPMPDALRAQPVVNIEYVSPLARAQKATEAQSILRAVDAVMPLTQISPAVARQFDWGEVSRGIAAGFGMPDRMLRDPKVVAAEEEKETAAMEDQRQQQQAMAAASAAPGVARAAADLQKAGLLGQGAAA